VISGNILSRIIDHIGAIVEEENIMDIFRRIFRTSTALLPVVFIWLCVQYPAISAEAVKITIHRQHTSNSCKSGYLEVNGKIVAYTLELPSVGNINYISSIPAGTYRAHLRYDKNDHWRVELEDVPGGRKGVQIHIGNTTEHSTGCILLGEKLSADLCSIVGGTSAPAYRKFKEACYGNSKALPEIAILVAISDN
jgi:hypothetical protein